LWEWMPSSFVVAFAGLVLASGAEELFAVVAAE
jgi:hypothetical protein